MAVDIGEGELGAGMGILASGDGPGARGPARQVDQVGDLGHLGALAEVAAVRGGGRDPGPTGETDNRLGHGLGQGLADTEAHVALLAGVKKVVRAAGRVGADNDFFFVGADRQLGQGRLEHHDVVPGGATAGVTGPQQPGQRLGGGVQDTTAAGETRNLSYRWPLLPA